MLVCFFHLHARLRVRLAPGFPCALCGSEGRRIDRTRAIHAAGTRTYASPSLRAKRSNPAIPAGKDGLLRRGACHRARVRATRWLAMTAVVSPLLRQLLRHHRLELVELQD